VVFHDRKSYKTFQLRPGSLTGEGIQARMTNLKQNRPFWDESRYAARVADLPYLLSGGPTLEDVRSYNSRLGGYYEEFARYLQELKAFEEQEARTLCLALWLWNTGGAPAQDIDLRMHFPDGFILVAEDGLPKPPKEPSPPAPPRTFLEKVSSVAAQYATSPPLSASLPSYLLHRIARPDVPANVSALKITRSKSYQVDCNVRRVKHNFMVPLDPMYVIFSSSDTAKSFHIQCQIFASNHPAPVECDVHVIVQK
jgi:hypothetical protein